MANKIITLSGRQFCGKDTVTGILLENLPGFRRVALADAIKIEYSRRTGLSRDEIEKNKSIYREDLINLGNEGRAKSSDFWLKKVLEEDGNIIVSDVRLPFELETFRQRGAFCIRVEANADIRASRAPLSRENDYTETALDNVENWDYVIKNEGSREDLVNNCKDLVEKIRKTLLN